jgi:hypothetical protein
LPNWSISEAIKKFLETDKAEVLCISGHWGVGKTYAWQEILQQTSRKGTVKLQNYSYVSLFGISSLDELKYAIFEKSTPIKRIGVVENTNSPIKRLDNLFQKWRNLTQLAKLFPQTHYLAPNLVQLTFWSVKNQLICIDDIERRSAKLDVGDVLGLISNLKEQRVCKIVLILNDQSLSEKDKRQFDTYLEKVIDVHLIYKPTAEEAADLALQQTSRSSLIIKEACVELGICNIRLIRKIEAFSCDLEPSVANFEDSVLRAAIRSLTLFCWVVYQPDVAPSLEFVKLIQKSQFARMIGNKELSEQEARWMKTLDNYRFGIFDDFKKEVLNGIQHGFFNSLELTNLGALASDSNKKSIKQSKIYSAWIPYRDNFDDVSEQLSQSIRQAYIDNVDVVSPTDLDSAFSLLLDLNYSDYASDIWESYRKFNKNNPSMFDLNIPYANEVKNLSLRNHFSEEFDKNEITNTPLDLLEKSVEKNNFSIQNLAIINSISEDDLYNFIKNYKKSSLSDIIRFSLSAQGNISQIMRAVLCRIGKENPLNARRVKGFGIDLSKPFPPPDHGPREPIGPNEPPA